MLSAAMDDILVAHTQRLTGLSPERVLEARDRLRALALPYVIGELVDVPTIDAAVGATLLADALDALVAVGVEETKLRSKLRKDPDVWPTWAELHAASLLSRYLEPGAEILLEPDRASGAQPDFRIAHIEKSAFKFLDTDSNELSIEFKALGLSDEEAEFCSRSRTTLDRFRPTGGFITLHAPIDFSGEVKLSRSERRDAARRASRYAKKVPAHARGISGVVVAAQRTEEAYLARLRARVGEALRQLPDDHDCCVAFHWSNGAPLALVSQAVRESPLPAHVKLVVLIGSAVVFPYPDIHNFISWGLIRRGEGRTGTGVQVSPR